jgi:Uma2 family endonuclease
MVCILVFMRSLTKNRERYASWLDEGNRGEFIEGKIVKHGPVSWAYNRVYCNLLVLISSFVHHFKCGELVGGSTIVRLTKNDYQPDLHFYKNEKAVGFFNEMEFFPSPDFIIEILSPDTAKYDKGIKLKDYAAHGILT